MAFPGAHLIVTLSWTSSQAAYQSKLYYQPGGSIGEENIVEVADMVNVTFQNKLRAVVAPFVTLQPVTLKYINGTTQIEDTSSENGAVGTYVPVDTLGEAGNDCLPEGDQIVIQRRTGLGGRNKRGRVFLPFVPERLVDNSALNASGITLYKAIATAMSKTIVAPGDLPLVPCTPDYKTNMLVPITHCRVVSEVCTRRDRRAPKRPVYFKAPVEA